MHARGMVWVPSVFGKNVYRRILCLCVCVNRVDEKVYWSLLFGKIHVQVWTE